ncbi:unnamed protein product [Taenia asiatica]|uniref:Uncharacterized protein n=1 Tax=Taenia asiatica TaxID=60517 RepID=A0A0R3WFT6_TAEAS|nr:unnamed protein product [Taenia asiatica]
MALTFVYSHKVNGGGGRLTGVQQPASNTCPTILGITVRTQETGVTTSSEWRDGSPLISFSSPTLHFSTSLVNASLVPHYARYALKYCFLHYALPYVSHAFRSLAFIFLLYCHENFLLPWIPHDSLTSISFERNINSSLPPPPTSFSVSVLLSYFHLLPLHLPPNSDDERVAPTTYFVICRLAELLPAYLTVYAIFFFFSTSASNSTSTSFVLNSWFDDNDVTAVHDDVEELDPIREGDRCHHSACSSISDDELLVVK